MLVDFRVFLVLGAVGVAGCHHDSPQPIGDTAVARACPTHLDLQLIGSQSRFDPGFSGLAHGVGLSTGSNLTVAMYECDPACRRCKFHGPVRPDPALSPVIPQRCLDNTQTICTQDSDCTDPFGFVCVNPGFGFGVCIGQTPCQ